MYICDFSRSVGAGSATTRKMRGLTRSVMALIVPPLPAPSRPSKTMQTFRPLCTTHCWSLTNSMCRRASSCSYSFRFSLPLGSPPQSRYWTLGHSSRPSSGIDRLRLSVFILFDILFDERHKEELLRGAERMGEPAGAGHDRLSNSRLRREATGNDTIMVAVGWTVLLSVVADGVTANPLLKAIGTRPATPIKSRLVHGKEPQPLTRAVYARHRLPRRPDP